MEQAVGEGDLDTLRDTISERYAAAPRGEHQGEFDGAAAGRNLTFAWLSDHA